MPKAGFKSITVAETVYDNFYDVYNLNKKDLRMNGIYSFAAYVTDLLEQSTRNQITFSKHQEVIKKISVDSDRIILQDTRINRIVELTIVKGELFCQFCSSLKCSHIGYCYSIHSIYRELNHGN